MYFLTQKINVSARDIGKTKNNSVLSKKQKKKTKTNSVKERLPLVVSLE